MSGVMVQERRSNGGPQGSRLCQKRSFLRKTASADWLNPFAVLYADCCVDVVLAGVDLPWMLPFLGADVALCANGP